MRLRITLLSVKCDGISNLIDIANWLVTALTDFGALQPTEQVTFVIGLITFVLALIVAIRGTYRFFKAPDKEVDDLTRVIKLLEAGKLTAGEAITLTNSLPRGGATPEAEPESPDNPVRSLVEEDEDRREFSKLVRDLATSDDSADRAVILQYARGDRTAALATLEAQAAAAGDEGADKWRDVAVLATPIDHDRAMAALARAIELNPSDASSFCRLSRMHQMDENPQAARDAADKALAVAQVDSTKGRALMRKALATASLGDTAQAAALIDQAVEAARAGASADPTDDERVRTLANVYEAQSGVKLDLGYPIEATAALGRALSLYDKLLGFRPNDEDLILDRLRAMDQRAYVMRISDDPEGSVAAYEALIPEIEAALEVKPDNRLILDQMANAQLQSAFSLDDLGEIERTLARLGEVDDTIRDLLPIAAYPRSVRKSAIWSKILRARILMLRGDVEGALNMQDAALQDARDVAKNGSFDSKRTLAVTLREVGLLRGELGNSFAAEENLTEARDILGVRAAADLADSSKQEDALFAIWDLAGHFKTQGDFAEYTRLAQSAHAKANELVKAFPAKPQFRGDVAQAEGILADALLNRAEDGDIETALEHSTQAYVLRSDLARINPQDFGTASSCFDAERIYAAYLISDGQLDLGLKHAKAALEKCEALETTPDRADRLASAKSLCHSALASAHKEANDFETSLLHHTHALELLKARYEAGPRVRSRRHEYIEALRAHGDILLAANQTAAAGEKYAEALDLVETSQNRPDRAELLKQIIMTSKLHTIDRRMGNFESARRRRAEVLALCEAQTENIGDMVAQSNLAIAYRNEAEDALIDGRTADAKPWIEKARALMPRFDRSPDQARHIDALLYDIEISVALNEGDTARSCDLIDHLVDLQVQDQDRRWTQAGELALYDLRLRQSGMHYEFGTDDPYLEELHESLQKAEGKLSDKVLSRTGLSQIWNRMGRIYSSRARLPEGAEAFQRAIALRNPDDDVGALYSVIEAHIDRGKLLLRMDDITGVREVLSQVAALMPQLDAMVDEPRHALTVEVDYLRLLAQVHLFEGDFEAAEARINSCLAVNTRLSEVIPNDSSPWFDRFEAISIGYGIAKCREDPDALAATMDDMRQVGDKAVELSDKPDADRQNVNSYLAVESIWHRLETGDPAGAMALWHEHEAMVRAHGLEPTGMFRPEILAMFLTAGAHACLQLDEAKLALGLSAEALDMYGNLMRLGPRCRDYARGQLRALYARAQVSCKDDDHAALRAAFQKLDEARSLPRHYPWIRRIAEDPILQG